MKHRILITIVLLNIIGFLTVFSSCSSALNETLYSELGDNYLSDSKAKENVLYSAYGELNQRNNDYFYPPELTSGEVWNEYGSIEQDWTTLRTFKWTSTQSEFSGEWTLLYSAIRDANIVIANTENSNNANDQQFLAEAKFIRGASYAQLHDWFGGLPLYLSPNDELYKAKDSSEIIVSQIEKDLTEAAELLPAKQSTFGRATKGAALGILSYVYLNDKQWQKAADVAKQVIDLGVYELYPDFTTLFNVEDEGNSEMIWVNQANTSASVHFVANILPTDYPHLSTQTLYASRIHTYDWFVNSYDDNDTRKKLFITSYTNTSGAFIQLLGNNGSYPYKYELDPNAIGANYGTDVPVLRYADILLIRAEALNELNGPNDESISLINQVRNRAKVSAYNKSDFTKETLRNAIFQERSWEFFFEQKSRTDEIRQGTFISGAKERGLDAKDYQVLFPIPQTELDANPKLTQNKGY